jgi:hypothetical protein
VKAAQLAIGVGEECSRKKALNLTQLRRNKRKYADKTSGRKRPRVADVDDLPADDADPEIAAALQQTVSGLQETHSDHEQLPQQIASASDVEPDDVESTSTPADIDLTDSESCAICHSFDDPPRDKLKKFSWVGCIKCPCTVVP